MSAFGTILAPLVATVLAAGDDSGPISETIELPSDSEISDVFGELAVLDTFSMSEASGGNGTNNIHVPIGNVGINDSETTGQVKDVNNVNTTSGAIANNTISANQGITTIFNNTGNGVVMQSTVNVNVFLD